MTGPLLKALWSLGEARLWMVADRWGQQTLIGQPLFLHWITLPEFSQELAGSTCTGKRAPGCPGRGLPFEEGWQEEGTQLGLMEGWKSSPTWHVH